MGLPLGRWFLDRFFWLNLYFSEQVVRFNNGTFPGLRQELLGRPWSENLARFLVLNASSRLESTGYLLLGLVLLRIRGLRSLFI